MNEQKNATEIEDLLNQVISQHNELFKTIKELEKTNLEDKELINAR